MHVSIIINCKAGSVNADLIEEKVRDALFRCDLHFSRPKSIEELTDFLHEEINHPTDYFIICGGDGTINAVLQSLMSGEIVEDLRNVPPIAIVRSGTANDLAHEMGVSERVNQAIRNILEGTVKHIDVVEVTGDGKKAYMLTNGGLGIPAVSAELANDLRFSLQRASTNTQTRKAYQFLAKHSYQLVKKIGPSVYSLMAMEAIRKWNSDGWMIDLDIPGQKTIVTTAPIIFINNQSCVGSSFKSAPFTTNSDGTVNLLLSESQSAKEHLHAAMQIRNGDIRKLKNFRSFELASFRLKSQNAKRPLTFFGDGEILHREVSELVVKCLHRGLPIVVAQ